MPKQKVDLRKVFQPQDSIAFLVIAIGLFIALFLDEMSVRLIGICITVLGGVALFMIVSPRLTDLQIITPVRPSATPDIGSQIIIDRTKTSQTFDPEKYKDTFGGADGADEGFIDPAQTGLFGDEHVAPPVRPKPVTTIAAPTAPAPAPQRSDSFIEVSDSDSGFRVLGVRKTGTAEPPPLVSQTRRRVAVASEDSEVQNDVPVVPAPQAEPTSQPAPVPEAESSPAFSTPTPLITGPVTEEISLSEDVVVRPKTKRDGETEQRRDEVVETPTTVEPVVQRDEEADEAEEAEELEQPVFEAVAEPTPEPVVPKQAVTERRSSTVSISTFVNDDDEDLASQEPRREFDYLLNRVLMVIRSATNARTAAFLWVNHERQQLVLEAKITEAETEFTADRKIPMGMDAVSQIAREGRPEIITQISPAAELDLLPYYVRPAQTMSFIGVPVYYGGNVVGILCADSRIEDAYSDITVGFFGQFTKLISGLVSSYTAKFDLLQSSVTLEAIRQFQANIDGTPTSVQQIVKALFATLIQKMDISRIGAVTFDHAHGTWTLTDARSAMDDGYRDRTGTAIDLKTSAVGHAIETASTVQHTEEYRGTRVFLGEPVLERGQFVAVPLCTATESYGALFLENLESSLSHQDVALAEALGEQAGILIDRLRTVNDLAKAALLDNGTGVLNLQGFEMRVREEFSRAVDYNMPLTLCVLHLDPSRTTAEQRERAVLHILRLIKNQLREYDLVARTSADELSLGLVGYRLQEAQNWTEQMRREIASTPVEVDGKRLSFTVSVGLAQSEPRDTWDDLIAHANAALDVSKRSGNKVTVFA